MACGKPVVASPVGINSEIVDVGINGFLPITAVEWKNAFKALHDNREAARTMGDEGRKRAVTDYSVRVASAALAAVIHRVGKQHKMGRP